MKKGRLLLLGVALLAGGGAFFMVAAGGGDDPAPIADIMPAQREIETVRVLVADVTFERGAVIDPAETAWIKWPADTVPEHVVTEDDEAFYEELPSRRARTTIYEGEPIIKRKTLKQGDRGVMAALLRPGMRAVSANISGDNTTSGFVLPGDRVDVMITGEDPNDDDMTITTTLLSDVRVIAIDTAIQTEGGPSAIGGKRVTFELTPDQAPVLVNAKETTTMTLILRSLFEGEVSAGADRPTDEVIVLRYGQG